MDVAAHRIQAFHGGGGVGVARGHSRRRRGGGLGAGCFDVPRIASQAFFFKARDVYMMSVTSLASRHQAILFTNFEMNHRVSMSHAGVMKAVEP